MVQLYLSYVSQSSDFYHHNHLCCFSVSADCLFRYRLSPETLGYTFVGCEAVSELNWLTIGSNGGPKPTFSFFCCSKMNFQSNITKRDEHQTQSTFITFYSFFAKF
jgi:hypothetical protein